MKINHNLNPVTAILYLVLVASWVTGLAIVKGFWMTLFSFCIPPIAWVILADFLLNRFNLV